MQRFLNPACITAIKREYIEICFGVATATRLHINVHQAQDKKPRLELS
jgi:hypothetical protein